VREVIQILSPETDTQRKGGKSKIHALIRSTKRLLTYGEGEKNWPDAERHRRKSGGVQTLRLPLSSGNRIGEPPEEFP